MYNGYGNGINGDQIVPEDFLTEWDRKVLRVLNVDDWQ